MANPPEYLTNEHPQAEAAEDLASPFGEPAAKPAGVRFGAFGNEPFFRDAEFSLRPRLYYRYHDNGESIKEALAIGGALDVTTGWWRDTLQLGVTGYTTQPLAAPSDRGSTGLLRPDGTGFSVLGQAWAKLRAGPATATLFRQELELPFINADDSRMIPNTFEAYRFDVKPSEVFRFGFAYVARMKDRTSADFHPMSEIAGAPGADRGTGVAGFVLGSERKSYLGAMDQWTFDLFNTVYVQAGQNWRLTDDFALRGDVQFIDQRSVGDELIGRFDAQLYGARLAASYRSAVLTLAFTDTEGASIFHPFGGDPAFNSVIVSDFDQAGEKSYRIGLSYDFARLGLTGVEAFASYAHGELPHGRSEDEVNATVDYRVADGPLKNLWLRLRYAYNSPSDAAATDEFRVILNYTFTF